MNPQDQTNLTNPLQPKVTVSPGALQFKQTTTKNGRPRARWTMKVSFSDGNVFTYRSDLLQAYFVAKDYKVTEIEAIVLKFTKVRGLLETAQVFDNSLPKGEETIMDYAAGKVMLNKLPRMSSGKSFSL